MKRYLTHNHPPAECDTAEEQDAWYDAVAAYEDEMADARLDAEADDEEDRDYADLIDERNAEWWADRPDPWPEHAAVVAAIHDRCASRTDACTTEPPF